MDGECAVSGPSPVRPVSTDDDNASGRGGVSARQRWERKYDAWRMQRSVLRGGFVCEQELVFISLLPSLSKGMKDLPGAGKPSVSCRKYSNEK